MITIHDVEKLKSEAMIQSVRYQNAKRLLSRDYPAKKRPSPKKANGLHPSTKRSNDRRDKFWKEQADLEEQAWERYEKARDAYLEQQRANLMLGEG